MYKYLLVGAAYQRVEGELLPNGSFRAARSGAVFARRSVKDWSELTDREKRTAIYTAYTHAADRISRKAAQDPALRPRKQQMLEALARAYSKHRSELTPFEA